MAGRECPQRRGLNYIMAAPRSCCRSKARCRFLRAGPGALPLISLALMFRTMARWLATLERVHPKDDAFYARMHDQLGAEFEQRVGEV